MSPTNHALAGTFAFVINFAGDLFVDGLFTGEQTVDLVDERVADPVNDRATEDVEAFGADQVEVEPDRIDAGDRGRCRPAEGPG